MFLTLSALLVLCGVVCAIVVLADVLRGHRQKMRVMEFVWAMTALYSGPLGLWAYYAMGCAPRDGEMKMDKPFWQTVVVSTSHCGAGCALGDVLGEALAFALALSFYGSRMWGRSRWTL